MKNLNVVAIVMHSNKEVLEHLAITGYYNPDENLPSVTQTQYHRRVKILDKITNKDGTYYLGMDGKGDMYQFTSEQILEIDNRANGLDILLKEKSQENKS